MHKEKKIFTELFIKPKESFKHYLTISENYRILLSGRFGIGKTTFLNHYFTESEEYNVIHLYPVNYSLLENEDIFSYVKYDILVSLFANNKYPLKPDYYSFLKSWDGFMLDNIGQVIATTMLLIPKIGKQLNQFVKELKQMSSDFKEYKKTKDEVEMDEINSFLSQFHNAEGGIYESNIITLIIQEWLKDIQSSGKTNILIIDDLDRIDPNHIFRLLNVFSAHFDNRDLMESKNKFGFSQVIFVCDVENIKSIYQSQFGVKTDFNGYLDKFYTKEIYRFDNRENIFSILDTLINSIQIGGHFSGGNYLDVHPDLKRIKETIMILIKPLIVNNSINLRSLFKFFNQPILVPRNSYAINGGEWFPIENFLLLAIYVLSQFIGDLFLLKEKISKMPNFIVGSDDHPALFIGDLIMINESPNSLETKTNLWGGNSANIEYNIPLKLGKHYKGEYMIYTPQRGKAIFSGLVITLFVDGNEIDSHFRSGEKLDILDLLLEVLNKIIG